MKASEVLQESEEEQLTALSQYLIGRADNKDSVSKLSVDAFVSIADRMGMSLDADSLQDMIERGVLDNVVQNIDRKELTFKSEKQVQDNPELSMDKARNTVNNMAQRAMRKRN